MAFTMDAAIISEEQRDELEALSAIYEDDFNDLGQCPPCFMIRLSGMQVQLKDPVFLKVSFPPNYPNTAPLVAIPTRSSVFNSVQLKALLNQLQTVATENLGMAMVFSLVEAAKDWINDNMESRVGDDSAPSGEECRKVEEKSFVDDITLVEPKVSGGRWDFVIGLIGKPSAGKSTFFNAATTYDKAKTAAHPFTTIEPNVGKAYYVIRCPCAQTQHRCDAAHGHSASGERFVPVLIKDVAGLVPGACDGKGRGNRFLNDLVDADVLVHVVDISGCTDEKGEQTTGYDPAQDVVWLQREIHQWIFNNIKEKWDVVKRRPLKLIDMFTGYHANKSVIYAAFQSAGIDAKELSLIGSWSDDVLHRLVAAFLKIRFPIFLALNKCDVSDAEANVERLRSRFPDMPCVPVSAQSECLLQRLHKDGCLRYQHGADQWEEVSRDTWSPEIANQIRDIRNNVFVKYGATNVLTALRQAVSLRGPVYAFPVQCLDTLTSVDKFRGEEGRVLRDCVTLKPATTVDDLYTTLTHYPLHLAAGDFIRAECLENGKKRIMKKDEQITEDNCILKIFTNRKVTPVKPKE